MIGATFLASVSTAFWMLIIFQFILGIGASGYHLVGISAAADMSEEGESGKKMSLQAIGGSLGVAFAPIAIGGLASVFGWRLPLRLVALIGIPLLFFLYFFFKETKPSKHEEQNFRVELTSIIAIVIFYFFRAFTFKGITSFLPTYFVEERGFSVAWGGMVTGIFFLSGAFAQLLGGTLADRYEETKVLIVSSLSSALLLYLITSVPINNLTVYLLLTLLGISLYSAVPPTLSLIHRINHHGSYGKAFGINATTTALAGLIAPLALGFIGDLHSLGYAFKFLPLMMIFAALPIFLIRKKQ